MKYVSIDVETTGLDPEKCQVIEFAAMIEDTSDPLDFGRMPKFRCFVEHEEYKGDAAAIKMNARVFDVLGGIRDAKNRGVYRVKNDIVPVGLLVERFASFLLKNGFNPDETGRIVINAAGKNLAGFDLPFLEKIPKWNRLIGVSRRVLDPAILFADWRNEVRLPGTRECVKRAEIVHPGEHDALFDAWVVVRLIRIGTKDYGRKV